MDAPPAQYVTTSDGMHIAYYVSGSGIPFIFTLSSFCHGQLAWQHPELRPWLEMIAARFRLVQYDPRGCGMSSRGLGPDHRMEHLQLDLEAVVNHLGLDRFIFFGSGYAGANVGIEYAANHPQRVAALIVANALLSKESIKAPGLFEIVARQDWETFLYSTIPRERERSQADYDVELLKKAINQDDFIVLMRAFTESNLADSLSRLTTPMLVLHPRGFAIESADEVAKVAQRARGRMVLINGSYSFGEADSGVRAIEDFLADLTALEAQRGASSDGLSAREIEVLRLVAAGKSNQEIADELVISLHTVRRHLSNLFDKTGVHNRTQAAGFARDHGIV